MVIDFTCRWFAIAIGYSAQYDVSGIWLYGPRRKERSPNGLLRAYCQFVFCWYDYIDGKRLWRNPWQTDAMGRPILGWRKMMHRIVVQS